MHFVMYPFIIFLHIQACSYPEVCVCSCVYTVCYFVCGCSSLSFCVCMGWGRGGQKHMFCCVVGKNYQRSLYPC